MQKDIELTLIYGSTREGRLCDKVAAWTTGEITQSRGFRLRLLDPAKSAQAGGAPSAQGELAAVRQLIDESDAFVVVTPEYNHGYPAALKALIDSIYEPWQAKPVGFVSYGGISGGLRAVEQLRQVFAELHATTIRDCVSFAGVHRRFDEHGQLIDPAVPARAMAVMLARLRWWALALRSAREIAPYAQAVA